MTKANKDKNLFDIFKQELARDTEETNGDVGKVLNWKDEEPIDLLEGDGLIEFDEKPEDLESSGLNLYTEKTIPLVEETEGDIESIEEILIEDTDNKSVEIEIEEKPVEVVEENNPTTTQLSSLRNSNSLNDMVIPEDLVNQVDKTLSEMGDKTQSEINKVSTEINKELDKVDSERKAIDSLLEELSGDEIEVVKEDEIEIVTFKKETENAEETDYKIEPYKELYSVPAEEIKPQIEKGNFTMEAERKLNPVENISKFNEELPVSDSASSTSLANILNKMLNVAKIAPPTSRVPLELRKNLENSGEISVAIDNKMMSELTADEEDTLKEMNIGVIRGTTHTSAFYIETPSTHLMYREKKELDSMNKYLTILTESISSGKAAELPIYIKNGNTKLRILTSQELQRLIDVLKEAYNVKLESEFLKVTIK